MSNRVLVVDDYELWRRHIRSALQKHPRWQIVGEAVDGLDAVQKARNLDPDLILLDVNLPTLDGIETARRILAVNPSAKILFLSEHRSQEIVEAALGTTACGYVLKSAAGRELLIAMQAVVDGKRFVSPGLLQGVDEKTADEEIPQKPRHHEAAFCLDEASLVAGYVRFAASALEAGNALILIVSGSRREQIHERLRIRGIDLDRAIAEGRYIPLEVSDLLSRFMIDGHFDDVRFLNAATAFLSEAASAVEEHSRVAAAGDGAATLWREGRVEAAIRVEQLWDALARNQNVDVFCGYLMTSVDDEADAVLQRIRAVHSAVCARSRTP